MKVIETSGKSVEAAIKNGLQELGCESSDVDIEILEMGSPGLFGMFGKLAKVRLTLKEKEDDFKIEMPVFSLEPEKPAKAARKTEPKEPKPAKTERKPEPKPEPEAEAAAPVEESAPEESREEETVGQPERTRSRRSRSRRSRGGERREEAAPAEESAPAPEREPETPFVPADPETWSDSAKTAVEFLSNTTRMMGVDVTIEVCQTEETLFVRMSGDTLGVLIGRRGETLDALQYLTSLHVNKDREEYLRVSLDSENYRAKREEALRKLALRMAQRARRTGRRVVLEPMNPYERRILHSALQGNPYVQTHSEGEDPYRRVIITLK